MGQNSFVNRIKRANGAHVPESVRTHFVVGLWALWSHVLQRHAEVNANSMIKTEGEVFELIKKKILSLGSKAICRRVKE